MTTFAEVLVTTADGTELPSDAGGAPDAPVLLLLAGASMSRDWWDDALCVRLAATAGVRVVRYDQRDTGAATCWPPGAPGYTSADLLADALAVLDAHGADRAHLLGMSMGGGVAQRLALEHPGRVVSLTLLATGAIEPTGEDLPPPDPALQAAWEHPPPDPDWTDPDAVAAYLLDDLRAYAGRDGVDEGRMRPIVARVVARSRDVRAGLRNHPPPTAPMDERPLAGLAGLPTLVLHGTHDPLFPPPHGEALARAIPGARLVPLDGGGHEVPVPRLWDEVVTAVADLVQSSTRG